MREQAVADVTKFDVELDRLRGEYRAYTALIEEAEATPPDEPDPAATVVIEGDIVKPIKKEIKRGQK